MTKIDDFSMAVRKCTLFVEIYLLFKQTSGAQNKAVSKLLKSYVVNAIFPFNYHKLKMKFEGRRTT